MTIKMDFKNILIIKLSAIGDVVHALPVAHALKTCFPAAKISWIVEKAAYDLLSGNPYLDEIIIFEKPKFKTLSGLLTNAPGFINFLRRKNFDLTLDLQGLFKSSVIATLSGASKRLVYENAREGSKILSQRIIGEHASGHVVERYLDVVRALGCQAADPAFSVFLNPEETERAEQILQNVRLDREKPYIVLALGANWPNKKWPIQNFAALCDRIYAKGSTPVAVGAKGDLPLFEELAAAAHRLPVNLVGKTTLKELAYVIRKASAFVGGDTGPMHLAAALGTRVVALMGPTDANRNGPYGKGHQVFLTKETCAGCWERKCPKRTDCLASISVEEVAGALFGAKE